MVVTLTITPLSYWSEIAEECLKWATNCWRNLRRCVTAFLWANSRTSTHKPNSFAAGYFQNKSVCSKLSGSINPCCSDHPPIFKIETNQPVSFGLSDGFFLKNTIKTCEKNSFMVINENIWELGSNYDYYTVIIPICQRFSINGWLWFSTGGSMAYDPSPKVAALVTMANHWSNSLYLDPPSTSMLTIQYPIGSMYAIYGNIYHQYTPNVSIYTIHGSYGYGITRMNVGKTMSCLPSPSHHHFFWDWWLPVPNDLTGWFMALF